MSLFLEKANPVSDTAQMLQPCGTLGLSDVTPKPAGGLPSDLEANLSQILYLTATFTAEG